MKLLSIALLLASSHLAAPARIVTVGPAAGRQLSLTFDAGSDRGYAPQILTTLERNHVRATFGMTGRWAAANPDLLHRMARDGDTFMNHTYDHRSFTGLADRLGGLSTRARTAEIVRTEAVIHRLTGLPTRPFFRPPYGDYDAATLVLLGRLGYRYMVMWTVDSLGWQRLATSTIIAHCLAGARPGAIILMHVGNQSNDAFALQPLITSWRRARYRFVTVPQLLGTH